MPLVRASWLLVVVVAACSEAPSTDRRDAGSSVAVRDGGSVSDGGTIDGAVADGGVEVLVNVEHERELRGVWVATVANINFPSQQGLGVPAMQAELDRIVDVTAATNLNAIFFQVRPEGDAVYASTLEPWSRFLTGRQGDDPGFDPLAYLLTIAHARGIEVHAWLNPYRAKSSRSTFAAPSHISEQSPEYAYGYGNLLWMDPGAAVVRARTVAVVEDLVSRYALDGLHFDDYFYPYPDGSAFPDSATYAAYQSGGGTLTLGDWRRDNVHQLVSAVWTSVQTIRPACRFGISPFGIYRPGIPEGITGLDQYAEIYADPVRWLDEGWVDYLAPQLYWPTTQTRQAYEPLLAWWSSLTKDGRAIFTGNYLSQLGSSSAWTTDEIGRQIDLSRAARAAGSLGNIFFHIGPLMEDRSGIATLLAEARYARPVLSPLLAEAPSGRPDAPSVTAAVGSIAIDHAAPASIFGWVVYRVSDDAHVVERIVGAGLDTVDLAPGDYVVTAVDRFRRESAGRSVTVE